MQLRRIEPSDSGNLINIDLPWNPTRLEQRIGRSSALVKCEKGRHTNLVNEQTVDEKVYEKLSERMQDRYNLLAHCPIPFATNGLRIIETMGEKWMSISTPRTGQWI